MVAWPIFPNTSIISLLQSAGGLNPQPPSITIDIVLSVFVLLGNRAPKIRPLENGALCSSPLLFFSHSLSLSWILMLFRCALRAFLVALSLSIYCTRLPPPLFGSQWSSPNLFFKSQRLFRCVIGPPFCVVLERIRPISNKTFLFSSNLHRRNTSMSNSHLLQITIVLNKTAVPWMQCSDYLCTIVHQSTIKTFLEWYSGLLCLHWYRSALLHLSIEIISPGRRLVVSDSWLP